jgi:hypothetical protein
MSVGDRAMRAIDRNHESTDDAGVIYRDAEWVFGEELPCA